MIAGFGTVLFVAMSFVVLHNAEDTTMNSIWNGALGMYLTYIIYLFLFFVWLLLYRVVEEEIKTNKLRQKKSLLPFFYAAIYWYCLDLFLVNPFIGKFKSFHSFCCFK